MICSHSCVLLIGWRTIEPSPDDWMMAAESDDSVILEAEVPFWTDAEDVSVILRPHSIEIQVGSSMHVVRSCWSRRCPTPSLCLDVRCCYP